MIIENKIAQVIAEADTNMGNTGAKNSRGMTKAERIASAARNFKFDKAFVDKASAIIQSNFRKYAEVAVPADIAKAQDKIVKKLGKHEDLLVAKVGVSVYAYGNTFAHIDELKAAGLHLAYRYEMKPYIWTPRKAQSVAPAKKATRATRAKATTGKKTSREIIF